VAAQEGRQVDQQRAGRFQVQAVGAPGGAYLQAGWLGVEGIYFRCKSHGAQRGRAGSSTQGVSITWISVTIPSPVAAIWQRASGKVPKTAAWRRARFRSAS